MFKKRYFKLRRGRRSYRVRIGGRIQKIRKIIKRLRIKFMRKWRPLRYRGGRCYVLVGRRWRIVIRKRRRWYISYKRHLRPLRRNFGTFKIYLAKRFRPLKRIGKKYYVKIGRKVRLMNHRYKLFFNYKGRRVTVRRKGRRARVLWRGKWRRSRRIRYRRPKIRGEEKISSSVVLTVRCGPSFFRSHILL